MTIIRNVACRPVASWLLLLLSLLLAMACASDCTSARRINGTCPAHVDGTLEGDETDLLQVRSDDASQRGTHAMFVIGSNNLYQTAKRIGVYTSDLRGKRAELRGYQREFRGLAKGRSYGAVCTPIRKPNTNKKLKGVLIILPSKSKFRIKDGRNNSRPAGTNTLKLMDTWEGAPFQYKRIKRTIHYYESRTSNIPRTVTAAVYSLIQERRIVIGNQSPLYKQSRPPRRNNRGRFPWKEYNNGMVSKGYVDAVLKMLEQSWGRGRVVAAQDFPPARGSQICTGRSCRPARTVVMFDENKCRQKGYIDGETGQRIGACEGNETFKGYVPKYNVNKYVRAWSQSSGAVSVRKMSRDVMGPPKPTSWR